MNARMSSWKEHPFSDTELEELIRGIDPATSKIHWRWGQILDPYGINRPIPEECDQIGRVYFVKSSPSDTWVCFYDLPKELVQALWARMKNEDEPDDWPFDEE